MKPFIQKAYYQPNALEKLLQKIPKKNFLIDINNLFASQSLESISNGQISAILEKYSVNQPERKYNNELCSIFTEFLTDNLGNFESDPTCYQSAKKMQELLRLTDSDFQKLYSQISLDVFTKKAIEILQLRKKYQEEEQSIFAQWANVLQISKEKDEEIINECRHSIVQGYFDKIIEDRRISPDEWEQGEELSRKLNVHAHFGENTKKLIEKYKKLWVIENEELPTIEAGILIQKNEHVYLEIATTLYEYRKVTKSVSYGGPAFRVKIMKGVYFRAGNVGVQRHSEDELKQIDIGVLYITNKKILFMGGNGNKTIKYNQIVDLIPYSDGFQISKESGKSPFFTVHDKDIELILATIARVIRDS